MRTILLAWLLGVIGLGAGESPRAQTPPTGPLVEVDLPAGPLQLSLNALGEQAAVDVFAPADLVRGKSVAAVSGTMVLE
ncbi:MAG: hypothetical protein AAGL66_12510, partial [Pseudomonadota bacterium]